MIDILMNLNPLICIISSTFFAVSIGLATYLFGRLLFAKHIDEPVEKAGVLLYRSTGLLLSLMLSMTFADTSAQFKKVQDSVVQDANRIVEIVLDLERFESNESKQIIRKCVEYLESVMNDEWPMLGDGRPNLQTWWLFIDLEDDILELTLDSQHQKEIKDRIINDIDEVSDNRHTRVHAGNVSLNWFLTLAVMFFAVSTFFYSVNAFRIPILIFIATYSMVIGLIIYSIIALSHPYRAPISVSVQPLKTAYTELMSDVKIKKILLEAPSKYAD